MRRSLLNTAIAGLDEIARITEASAPDLSRAFAHQKLGDIFREVGRTADARRQYESARRLTLSLSAADPRNIAIAECHCKAQTGLGELSLLSARPKEAEEHFREVVLLSEMIVSAYPNRQDARRLLIEAYLRLGRAYGFNNEFVEGEKWLQKSLNLAKQWVADDPNSTPANEMLAWSYRKLADMKKFSDHLDLAREDYSRAIAINRDLVRSHPQNNEFKEHLAVALEDLAGVEFRRRQFATARPLFTESEQLFIKLSEVDSENLNIWNKLIHAQTHFASLECEQAQFAAAAELYRGALQSLDRMNQEGRSTGLASDAVRKSRIFRQELAYCEFALTSLVTWRRFERGRIERLSVS